MKQTFCLEKYGRKITIALKIAAYMEGNLAIQMMNLEDGEWEPWNTLTVNLGGRRDKNCAFIDTNNNGEEILAWIIRNGLAVPTGRIRRSGFCAYPEYRFREAVLWNIDPEGYDQYQSMVISI